eukprot:3628515-Alexandrium_andersonii.AAC.1
MVGCGGRASGRAGAWSPRNAGIVHSARVARASVCARACRAACRASSCVIRFGQSGQPHRGALTLQARRVASEL